MASLCTRPASAGKLSGGGAVGGVEGEGTAGEAERTQKLANERGGASCELSGENWVPAPPYQLYELRV